MHGPVDDLGMQDGRRDLAEFAASHLLGAASDTGPERVSDAAAGYATALKKLGLKLLPVPEDVIRNIAFQNGADCPARAAVH